MIDAVPSTPSRWSVWNGSNAEPTGGALQAGRAGVLDQPARSAALEPLMPEVRFVALAQGGRDQGNIVATSVQSVGSLRRAWARLHPPPGDRAGEGRRQRKGCTAVLAGRTWGSARTVGAADTLADPTVAMSAMAELTGRRAGHLSGRLDELIHPREARLPG